MKPTIENLKEYTTKASLTSEEKLAMFQNIRNYSATHPVHSPYSIFLKRSFLYASMFTILIGTSATSFAAERSLPGDILYSVKTNFNEEIVKSFSITKSQKVKTNINLVDKRMAELTEMVVKQKDTPEKIDIIASKLEKYRIDLENEITTDDSDEADNTEAAQIYTQLESIVDTHLDILEELAQDEKDTIAYAKVISSVTASTSTPTLQANTKDDTKTNTAIARIPSIDIAVMKAPAPEQSEEVTGEDDAVIEVSNFSVRIESSINLVKAKRKELDTATSTRLNSDIRKKIIEDTEKKLNIDIDSNTESDIQS